jgi:Protein of unknown function DUF262
MARVEPRTISIEELVHQVRHGLLRCPRFDRHFVWRGDQVLTFFDSIRLRYPVGNLLIWRTRNRYASFDHMGPIPVPTDRPVAPAEIGYVLDGQQRLSVLFGVFALSDPDAASLRGSDRVFLVYYDLEEEVFAHTSNPRAYHLPVRYLLGHEDELVSWLDERRNVVVPSERLRWDVFRRRATQLQATFAQYRLFYIDITDAGLDEAVQIFSRINSHGTSIRGEDVFAALTWNPGVFDFADASKALLEEYPNYQNFGTTSILQCTLAALGEDLYAQHWTAVFDTHRDRLPEVMEGIRDAFGLAVEFLNKELGAASGKVVPYGLQLVLLTEFFRVCPQPELPACIELVRWLWATSFASAYSSVGHLEINAALRLARRLAQGEPLSLLPDRLRLRPFPRRFHPKSARVRVFHLFLKTRRPRDLQSGEVLPDTLLSNGMADARAVVRGGRLAGRLLVGAGRRPLLRDLEALARTHTQTSLLAPNASKPDTAAILRSHLIPDDALPALLRGDMDTFLDLREREIICEERAFASQYVDLSDEETEEEAEIDVEEEPESDM